MQSSHRPLSIVTKIIKNDSNNLGAIIIIIIHRGWRDTKNMVNYFYRRA